MRKVNVVKKVNVYKHKFEISSQNSKRKFKI